MVIALLGDRSPCRGNIFLQVQGALEKTALLRDRFRRKSGCGFGIMMYYMY